MSDYNEKFFPHISLCKKLTEIDFPLTDRNMMKWQGFQTWDVTVQMLHYVMPSIMEMLEFIRCVEWLQNHEFWISINHVLWDKYNVAYQHSFWPKYPIQDTLPNALVWMCIWLHENNFISFK